MYRPIRKALTFRASSIGDCLMGKYLLENVHEQFPDARCGIVVASRAGMIRDLFAAYPWLEIIEANRHNPRALFSLLRNFWGSELVVTQYAGKRGGRFSFASKCAARLLARRPASLKLRRGTGGLVGFTDSSPWNGLLYDVLLPRTLEDAPAALERTALRSAGISVKYERPTMQCAPIKNITEKFGLISGQYLVVHLFAGNKGRGLSPAKKRELLNALAEKLPNIRLVVSGSAPDREEAREAARDLPATVIAGDATLQELMNLIEASRGVVSIDTGVAHLTAQLRKPLIVLTTCLGLPWWGEGQYGKDSPTTLFTRADLCADGHLYKDFPDCLSAIDMNAVATAAKEFATQQ